MDSDHNLSAADKDEPHKGEDQTALLKETIRILVQEKHDLIEQLRDRHKGDPSDATKEFERLAIQESGENIVEEYHKTKKDLESSETELNKLKEIIKNLKEKITELSEELEHHKKLNKRSREVAKQNIVLQMQIIDLQMQNQILTKQMQMQSSEEESNDSLDGANKPNEENFNDQGEPSQLAGFDNPYNCKVSCVPSVVHFIFFRMNLQICNKRFMMEMQCTLSEVSEVVPQVTNCSLSFEDFHNVGLIKNKPAYFKEPTGTEEFEIQKAIESVDGQHPALFKMHPKVKEDGTKDSGHCIALFPSGLFLDVQKRRYWKPTPRALQKLARIEVWKIDVEVAKEWEEKCGLKRCELECTVCTAVPVSLSEGMNNCNSLEKIF